MKKFRVGTCSWNYESWLGLVYSFKWKTSAPYLVEYSKHYKTAEIDSWFYNLPEPDEVKEYKENVPKDFTFTLKVPRELTMTHIPLPGGITSNSHFLSMEFFEVFYSRIEELLPQVTGIIFQFPYFENDKISSLSQFLFRAKSFFPNLPKELPIGIEVRNKDFLNDNYFDFLTENNIIPVLSEMKMLPTITETYEKNKLRIGDNIIIRLLGGDRKEIELRTKKIWDEIRLPKMQNQAIAEMIVEMLETKNVILNVNNHYEGSAPKTIQAILEFMKQAGYKEK
ncbi:MAG: DUF72 domain-containing protein [Ignavibacteriales bacterium]|jgi:uncharacterized protein YecE (DUF72 family)|nr:DUF72 domain-containing protein [Ignavibacteriaceae bacterium]NLH61284.1 DUF72 domain-containing protein [Ignavibacteriales bacterium]HOJ19014.1 DUF72 domain-containing protein [Ignavibacteriaceae bacterium]